MYPGQGGQGARANPSCVMSPVSGKCQTLVHTDQGTCGQEYLNQHSDNNGCLELSTYILLITGIPIPGLMLLQK